MAPFTFVGPTYAGSALLLAAFGCVIVLVGHCTRNDCAPTGNARTSRTAAKPREINWWLDICDLRLLPAWLRTAARALGCEESVLPVTRSFIVRATVRPAFPGLPAPLTDRTRADPCATGALRPASALKVRNRASPPLSRRAA